MGKRGITTRTTYAHFLAMQLLSLPMGSGLMLIRYVIRRILWGILVLILVSALTFLFFRIFPTGNPAVLRAGRDPQPKLIKEIEKVLGLDKSLPVQFWDYMKEIFFHFKFGYSYYSQESVRSLIAERLPATLSLTVGSAASPHNSRASNTTV